MLTRLALLVLSVLLATPTLLPPTPTYAASATGNCGEVRWEGWDGGNNNLRNYVGVFSHIGEMQIVKYERAFVNWTTGISRSPNTVAPMFMSRDHYEDTHDTYMREGYVTATLRGQALINNEIICTFRTLSWEITMGNGGDARDTSDGVGMHYNYDKTLAYWRRHDIAGNPPTNREFNDQYARPSQRKPKR